MDVGGESAFSSDSVEHASTENHVSRSTASLRQGKPPNTGVDAYQGPISHSLLYKVGVKDKRARAASIELQSVRSRSNSSKPFSWNHTTSRSTTEGSSASSEASVIVIDNAHKMKSRNKTLCDSVVVPTFKR